MKYKVGQKFKSIVCGCGCERGIEEGPGVITKINYSNRNNLIEVRFDNARYPFPYSIEITGQKFRIKLIHEYKSVKECISRTLLEDNELDGEAISTILAR